MNRVIIFDVGQVLVRVAFPEFMEKFAAEFNFDPSVITKNRNNGAHIDFMTGKITPQEFHQITCQFFNHYISLEEFRQLWLQMLAGQIDETAAIVDELLQKKYQLALLSNIDPWHYEFCRESYPVIKKIDRAFLSYELKLKKPDPEIFKKVAHELGVDAKDCLLVDDMLENVEAAQQVGFEAIHFTDAAHLRHELIKKGVPV